MHRPASRKLHKDPLGTDAETEVYGPLWWLRKGIKGDLESKISRILAVISSTEKSGLVISPKGMISMIFEILHQAENFPCDFSPL